MPRHFLGAIGAVLLLAVSAQAQAQAAAAAAPAAASAAAAVSATAAKAKAAVVDGAASAKAAVMPAATAAAPAAASIGDASEGKVAYYGRKFAGRKTANGERFNPGALTMAHKTLPFGTLVRVTNLKNNKSVVVRVNDRGPFGADRVGDLSQAAAGKLRMLKSGVINAKLEVVGKAKSRGGKHHAGMAHKPNKSHKAHQKA